MIAFIMTLTIKSLFNQTVEGADGLVIAVFSCIGLLGWWGKSVQAKRCVEIDLARKRVRVHTVSSFFASRIIEYPLDIFGAIRSYLALGRERINRVELVTKAGGEALLVAAFKPRSSAASFWSIPSESESEKAASIRRQITAYAALHDHGFLGARMVGAQLKDR